MASPLCPRPECASALSSALRERDEARASQKVAEGQRDAAFRETERLDPYLKVDGSPCSQVENHYNECPTYYDGCHCTVSTLEHNINRALKAERALAAAEAERDAAREALAEVAADDSCAHAVTAKRALVGPALPPSGGQR